MTQRLDRRATQKHDVLQHLNRFDFGEKYMSTKTPAHIEECWNLARAGKFGPYAPSKARGEETVCKLMPQELDRFTGTEEQKTRKRKAGKPTAPPRPEKLAKQLRVDGADLLPSDGDEVFFSKEWNIGRRSRWRRARIPELGKSPPRPRPLTRLQKRA